MAVVKSLLKYLMAVLYIGAGILHFVNPDFYLRIMPDFIPAHALMVQLSGVAEIALGVMLLIPATQKLAAWGIIAMLLIFMLVHVDMVARPQNYGDVPYWGLVARLPLQFVLMLWAWWYTREDSPRLTRD